MSFEEAYSDYLIYAEKRHKKQGFEIISRDFKLHILPYFKGRDVTNLTKLDIITWQTEILSKNFSNNFNRNLYYEFSSFIQFCVYHSYLTENIVLNVERFKKKTEVKHYDVYNIHEFRKFRKGLDNIIYKHFFNFMFFVGTRPSEAMALKFSDLRGKYVYISHNIHRRGKRELDTPKNQSSIRYVKLSLLMRIRIFILKCYYLKKYGYDFDYFIFGGKSPLAPTSIDRYKLKACKKVNIRPITQHQFRHSYATRLIHKGKSIDFVSKSMGHSKVSMTLDVYLHQKKKVPETLSSRFNFFEIISRDFKKLFQFIITFLM